MKPKSFPFRVAAFAGPALAAVLLSLSAAEPAKTPAPPGAADKDALYDPDPQHLWNRLDAAIHLHRSAERGEYDDHGDPFPFGDADNLLAGDGNKRVVALLDEFLSKHGEKSFDDPLKRALLQRDLWALFDHLAQEWPRQPKESDKNQPARRELALRLVKAVRRLAPSAEQVQGLPDNFADAAAAKAFPAAFDPDHERAAFLPADLWEAKGPWVLLGDQSAAPVASTHTQFFGGLSAFHVFLNLPGGREDTLKYLQWGLSRRGRGDGPPQFPAGTQVALVRQALLIDDRDGLTPTRLTEAVQLRVIRDPNGFLGAEVTKPAQDVFEFRLDRQALLAGKAGGLRAVGDEDGERSFVLYLGNAADPHGSERVLASCRQCHSRPGIRSVNSFYRDGGDDVRGGLLASDWASEANNVARWKRAQFSWGLFQGLLEVARDE